MQLGPNRMGFLIYDEEGGGIGVAIVQGEGYIPSEKGIRIYLNGGDDLNTVLHRVEGAGAKIVLPKTQIAPDLGYFAVFIDCEGNQLALHSMN